MRWPPTASTDIARQHLDLQEPALPCLTAIDLPAGRAALRARAAGFEAPYLAGAANTGGR
ncbi:MAG: hypothetical protein RLZZ598_1157 [Pseudomonadota bacterium]